MHNLSAIMAKGYAFNEKNPTSFIDNIRETQRLLIFRLIHAINREQEIALPMIISYLMKWGDVIKSHQYTTIYWSSFVNALCREFPALQVLNR
jgi:hypothetical protein